MVAVQVAARLGERSERERLAHDVAAWAAR
jgi:hypothetical protein